MATNNTFAGSGTQNNHNAVVQSINHGRDQIFGRWELNIAGDLVKNFGVTLSDGRTAFERLWDVIAGVGASHNAEHQFSRGQCLQGTREKVLRIIRHWRRATQQGQPICWLSGAAGIGKTAIAITLAKTWEAENALVSSFFFFRSDPRRNNFSAFVLTLAHGLAQRYPSCKASIEKRISDDQKILEANLEDQFRELVLKPALEWAESNIEPVIPRISNVIVIDGLDECDNEDSQLRILSLIHSALQQIPRFPFRFLVVSRPEAWIQEAFVADSLRRLTRFIMLDDKFLPDRDIMQYYLHHFQEIVSSPKYSQVRFPTPWPSEKDLKILVSWSSGQFIYAVTVIKFLKLAFNHPVEQLCVILKKTPNRKQQKSPFPELDALYDVILSANPDYDQVLLILAAILIFSNILIPSPEFIELVLGLSSGQVALTLRAMHSVLDIQPWTPIRIYHNSFREYLVNQDRSRKFYIDKVAQRHVIVHRWLQSLQLASKLWASSPDQPYNLYTKGFFTGWMAVCQQIGVPTPDLLENIWSIDSAYVFLNSAVPDEDPPSWNATFNDLVSWLQRSHKQHCEAVLNPDETQIATLYGRLVEKFSTHPNSFHLDNSLGQFPSYEAVTLEAVSLVTQCSNITRNHIVQLRKEISPHQGLPHLTDCHCDLSGGKVSDHPKHLAFQDACLELFKVLIKMSGVASWMELVFVDVAGSQLLHHCRVDQELLSLCQTFFDSALAYWRFDIEFRSRNSEKCKENLIRWIGTFRSRFTEEAKVLESQVNTLLPGPPKESRDSVRTPVRDIRRSSRLVKFLRLLSLARLANRIRNGRT
ncbi:hypothetical protein PM082_006831 [Marasmius tenuissimus]|nr:hypothetical protein PM082_006831 [Marasmius tenuissimus]